MTFLELVRRYATLVLLSNLRLATTMYAVALSAYIVQTQDGSLESLETLESFVPQTSVVCRAEI